MNKKINFFKQSLMSFRIEYFKIIKVENFEKKNSTSIELNEIK